MTEKVLSQNTEKELEESGHTEVSNLKKSSLLDEDLRFKTFTEQSPNMIFINKRGQIVYVNKKCEEVMGYTKEEFLSPDFDFMQLIAPESVDFMATNFRLHLSGQELAPYEYVLISKKGERLDAIITSKLIDYEGEQALLGIVTNITDRKQAEKSLQESEESYRKLISEMCNGFVLNEIELDQNGMPDECRFIEVNPAFENITGLATEDIVGKTVTEVFPGTESFWVDQCGEI
ncbi:MAG: PAS domain S-box protein, partial [Desulfobacterales bacterium]